MPGTPSISVVIPAHRRPDLLSRGLEALASNEATESLAEVIVVENGGHAGLDAVCARHSEQLPIRYIYEEAGNLGQARNAGYRVATGKLVVFLDDDIRVAPRFIEAYAQAFQTYGEARFYGGPLDADYEEPPSAWLVPYLPASARGFSLSEGADPVTDPAFLGGNIAIPRSVLERLGGFDGMSQSGKSNAGFVGEETRLQQRMLSCGLLGCYVAQATGQHWVPRERCSLAWLIARRKRSGATDALLRSPLRGFPPRWMLRAWSGATLRILSARIRRKPAAAVVTDLLRRSYLNGYIAQCIRGQTRSPQ